MLSIARLALAMQQLPALSTSFVGEVQVNKCIFEAQLKPTLHRKCGYGNICE